MNEVELNPSFLAPHSGEEIDGANQVLPYHALADDSSELWPVVNRSLRSCVEGYPSV